jgi:hypothetical protein
MSSILINPFISFPAASGSGATDPDAAAYIAAVEAEDGDVLEAGVVTAIDNFVIGCKADGIWTAIKACCILAGARTRLGALTPLVGAAPTSFNFVNGDYNRETGLVGDGSTKYLNSNRANNADPLNNVHIAAYVPAGQTGSQGRCPIGANGANASAIHAPTLWAGLDQYPRCRGSATVNIGDFTVSLAAGIYGVSRSVVGSFVARAATIQSTVTATSDSSNGVTYHVFSLTNDNTQTALNLWNQRLSFYSIGESLDLALLDARVSTLMDQYVFTLNTGLNPNDYEPETVAYVAAGYRNGGTLA